MANKISPSPKALFVRSSLFLSLLAIFFLTTQSAYSEEGSIDNKKLYEMIGGKAHDVMTDQLTRLRTILEGFLTGDWASIESSLSKMTYDIDRIADKYKDADENQIPQPKALE